jgi:signal transduction histidine kinase
MNPSTDELPLDVGIVETIIPSSFSGVKLPSLPITSSLSSKTSIIQSINHEMRSPLNAALCGLHLLTESELPLADKVDMVEIIKQSVLSATDALNDAILLDLLRRKELYLHMTVWICLKLFKLFLMSSLLKPIFVTSIYSSKDSQINLFSYLQM